MLADVNLVRCSKVPCNTAQCSSISHKSMHCSSNQFCAIAHTAILEVLYCTTQCNSVQYYIVPEKYYTIQSNSVQCYTVQEKYNSVQCIAMQEILSGLPPLPSWPFRQVRNCNKMKMITMDRAARMHIIHGHIWGKSWWWLEIYDGFIEIWKWLTATMMMIENMFEGHSASSNAAAPKGHDSQWGWICRTNSVIQIICKYEANAINGKEMYTYNYKLEYTSW